MTGEAKEMLPDVGSNNADILPVKILNDKQTRSGKFYEVNNFRQKTIHELNYLFIYLISPTRAGSPQQLMPITVGPHYLTHPVNFLVGGNRSTRRKPTTFRRALTCALFT